METVSFHRAKVGEKHCGLCIFILVMPWCAGCLSGSSGARLVRNIHVFQTCGTPPHGGEP